VLENVPDSGSGRRRFRRAPGSVWQAGRVGDPAEDLPPTLRHQMDDWDEQVRHQQLAFAEAAEGLEGQAAAVRARLAEADEPAGGPLRRELDLYTALARNARTMARIPFPIPDEGVAVRESPDGPVYLDPDDPAVG
jgi:hypothetical protein